MQEWWNKLHRTISCHTLETYDHHGSCTLKKWDAHAAPQLAWVAGLPAAGAERESACPHSQLSLQVDTVSILAVEYYCWGWTMGSSTI